MHACISIHTYIRLYSYLRTFLWIHSYIVIHPSSHPQIHIRPSLPSSGRADLAPDERHRSHACMHACIRDRELFHQEEGEVYYLYQASRAPLLSAFLSIVFFRSERSLVCDVFALSLRLDLSICSTVTLDDRDTLLSACLSLFLSNRSQVPESREEAFSFLFVLVSFLLWISVMQRWHATRHCSDSHTEKTAVHAHACATELDRDSQLDNRSLPLPRYTTIPEDEEFRRYVEKCLEEERVPAKFSADQDELSSLIRYVFHVSFTARKELIFFVWPSLHGMPWHLAVGGSLIHSLHPHFFLFTCPAKKGCRFSRDVRRGFGLFDKYSWISRHACVYGDACIERDSRGRELKLAIERKRGRTYVVDIYSWIAQCTYRSVCVWIKTCGWRKVLSV